MAGMPMEEASITEAFKIRMTCIHRQLQKLSLFHVYIQVTQAAII